MTNHVFGDKHRTEYLAVMHEERMSHKFGRDRGPPRPSLDGLLYIRSRHLVDFLVEMLINERTFF